MSCKNYRKALMEAAATNAAPSREMRSHMKACESCRAAFSEEMQLFAAIDTGLQAAANAEVPASLLPRVRAHLNERPASRRFWVPAFVAVAVAAALVFAFVLARKSARVGVEPNPLAISSAHDVPPVANLPALAPGVPLDTARAARERGRVEAVKTAPVGRTVRMEAEVLIPAGQKGAFDVLLARLQKGEVQGAALLAEKPEKPLETLEVSPLDISPIEIKPLPDVATKSTAPDEKAGR